MGALDFSDKATPVDGSLDFSDDSLEAHNRAPSVMDVAKAALVGYIPDTAKALGWGLEKMGVEHGTEMRKAGAQTERDIVESMTPGGQRAYNAPVFEGDGLSDLHLSDKPGGALAMGALRSIPQMAMTAPIGGPVAAGVSRVIPAAARSAPGLKGLLARNAPGALGFGGAEGLQAATQNAEQTQSEIEGTSHADLEKSPRYLELLETMGREEARKTLAAEAASDVFKRTLPWTGGVGIATGGGALGELVKPGAKSVLKGIVKGAGEEALQEAPQSAGEELIQNLAKRDYVDPTQDPWKGVAAAGASGAAIGGVTGGALGGGAHAFSGRTVDGEVTGRETAVDPLAAARGAAQDTESAAAVVRRTVDSIKQRVAAMGAQPKETTSGNEPSGNAAADETGARAPAGEGGAKHAFDFTGAFKGAGRGISDDFYKKAFDALTAGSDTIAGVKDPVLKRARGAFDAGEIASPDDLRKFEERQSLDGRAHEAASSPKNERPEPSDAQIHANNAKLGHADVWGMDISFENPAGSTRTDKKNKPPKWSVEMKDHYGYIKRTKGFDKDHLDAFVKPGTQYDFNGPVYIVNQGNDAGKFDEHKTMIGYGSQDEAKAAYLANYDDPQKASKRIRSIVSLPMEKFKEWAYHPSKGPSTGELILPATHYLDAKHVIHAVTPQQGVPAGASSFTNFEAARDARLARLKSVAKDKKIVDVDRDSIITAVQKLGGINMSHRLDIIGDDKGNSSVFGTGHLFTKAGHGPDDMATRLGQYGYLTQAELDDVDGGVQALKDKIRDEFDGHGKHFSLSGTAMEREAEANYLAEEEYDREASALVDQVERPDDWSKLTEDEQNARLDDLFGADTRERTAASDEEAGARDREETLEQRPGEREPGQDDEEVDGERPKASRGDRRAVAERTDSLFDVPADAKPALELKGQTEAEIKVDADAKQRADDEKKKKEAAPAPEEFNLSGSDRKADVAAAHGQKDLLAAPANAEPKRLLPADRRAAAAAKQEASAPITLADHDAFRKRLYDGEVSIEEYKAQFERVVAQKDRLIEQLEAMKKDDLLKQLGGFSAQRYKSEKKERIVQAAYDGMQMGFTLSRGLSFSMGKGAQEAALRKMIDGTTAADLKEFADRVAAQRKERKDRIDGIKKALKNPETLAEFEDFIKYHKAGEPGLTSEQRAKYDELVAEKTKGKRVEDQEKKATVQAAGELVGATITETKHTQKGHDLFVVKLERRVERDVYEQLSTAAKKLGGYYSSYTKGGAVAGFQFKAKADAEAFQKLAVEGDAAAATEAAIERKGDRREEKKNAAAERLAEMADKLEATANESLNKDRLSNTNRRARMAGNAEAAARSDIAFAKTLRNLSEAIESGEAKHLDGIRTKAQVATLTKLAESARYETVRKQYPSYVDFEKHGDRPLEVGDIDAAEYPALTGRKEDFQSAANRFDGKPGSKRLADRFRKMAQAIHDDAWHAMGRQIVEEAVEKAGADTYAVPWHWAENLAKIKRLEAAGIPNVNVLRAALREFIQFKGEQPKADKVKELERALVGKDVGFDFFPTPAPLAARMAEMLDVKPGMRVLEPSAGKGNLADAVRDEYPGAEVDVVEQSNTLREILKEKGYSILGHDFNDFEKSIKYDRIIMNPPFSDGIDADHVRKAYAHLAPGGRLVAIAGEGIFFRKDKKSQEFREWFDSVNGTSEQMEGAFLDRHEVATTGVNSRLLVIDKSAEQAPMASRQSENIEEYKPQTKTGKSGQPLFWNDHIALAKPDFQYSLADGERTVGYGIYDVKNLDAEGKPTKVGSLLMDLGEDDKVVGLQNIEIRQPLRQSGKGLGETVIATLLAHNGALPIRIHNIQHHRDDGWDALPFWKKMGTQLDNFSTDPEVEINGWLSRTDYLKARGVGGKLSRGLNRATDLPAESGTADDGRGRRGEGDRGRARAGGVVQSAAVGAGAAQDRLRADAGGEGAGERGRAGTSSGNGQGLTPEQVRARLIEAFGPKIDTLLQDKVLNIVETPADLPPKLAAVSQSLDEAWYDPKANDGEGAIYFIASGLRPERVVPVLLHELGEHYNLPKMLGADGYAALHREVRALHARGTSSAVEDAWRHVRENYPSLKEADVDFAAEVIAKVGESAAGRNLPFFKRLMAAVRTWLLKLGLKANLVGKLTDEDLRILVEASARQAIRKAGSAMAFRDSPMQARAIDKPKKEAALTAYAAGKTADEVADEFKIGATTVLRWADEAGIVRSAAETKGVTDEKRTEVIRLYDTGLSVAKVSHQTGLGTSTVHRIVTAAGSARSLAAVRDAPADVKARALELYGEGKTTYEVAQETGVSQTGVARWAVEAGISRGYSGAQALRVALGRNNAGYGIKAEFSSGKSGGSVKAMSLYELARFGQLEADDNVTSFSKATDRIPYGDGRHYVPDVEVKMADGSTIVEEIKPEYQLDDPVVQEKAAAAVKFYEAKGVKYQIVTERTIGLAGFDTVDVDAPNITEADRKRAGASLAAVRAALRQSMEDERLIDESEQNDAEPKASRVEEVVPGRTEKFGKASYARFSVGKDRVSIFDINAVFGDDVSGRRIVKILKERYKRPVYAIGVIEEARGFWDKMIEEGLLAGYEDEDGQKVDGDREPKASRAASPQTDLFGSPEENKRKVDLFTPRGQDNLADRAKSYLASFLDSDRTFNWWHRSVGTQYHKATVSAPFRRVFNEGQAFLTDTNRFSMQAEEKAPQVLLRVEGIKDLTKRPPSPAEIETLGRTLFEGTLFGGADPTKGKVFTDEELKAKGLNDKQVGLYRQVRASIDDSIDTVAKSTIARLLRTYEMTIDRDMTLADVTTDALEQLEAHRAEQNLAIEAQTEDPAERHRVSQQIDAVQTAIGQVDAIRKRAVALQQGGYMPLMRFGRHSVNVFEIDDAGKPKEQFFGLYESQGEANRAAAALKQEFPNATIEKGMMSKEAYRIFQGISPDTIELFSEIAGLDEHPLMQQYIQMAVSERSAMKRMLKRKGVPGFDWDVPKVLANFITSNARAASGNYHHAEMLKSIEEIPKGQGDVKDEAVRLYEYLTKPQEEAAALRGYMFFHFMGGSIATAMVNMTQPVMMTAPRLAVDHNIAKVSKELGRAMLEAARQNAPTDAAGKAMKKAEEEGIVAPHEIYQLMAEAKGGIGRNIALRQFTRVWGGLFSLAEAWNRKATFLAAYRLAESTKGMDPYDYAVRVVNETQGLYNRGNRPNWGRGAIGSTVMTFRQYGISYLELLKRLPAPQRALALGILVLAAGIQGLPGADDLDDILDTLGQWMGYATNSKQWKRKAIEAMVGKDIGQFVLNGASAIPAMPLDVQMRLGLGNLIPGTSMFKPSDGADKGQEIAEAFGPAGGLAKSGFDVAREAFQGDIAGMAKAGLPASLRNAYQALEMFQTGEYRDSKNRRVVDARAQDAFVKAIGFNPTVVARESRKVNEALNNINLQKETETSIVEQWVRGLVDHKDAEVDAARERLAAWNEKNPDLVVAINKQQIARRVREARRSREDRFVRAAPKEIRGTVLQELRD